jgi:hypothetical protein
MNTYFLGTNYFKLYIENISLRHVIRMNGLLVMSLYVYDMQHGNINSIFIVQ